MQHDRHVWDRTEHLLETIMEALGISLPICDLSEWYACGDDLI